MSRFAVASASASSFHCLLSGNSWPIELRASTISRWRLKRSPASRPVRTLSAIVAGCTGVAEATQSESSVPPRQWRAAHSSTDCVDLGADERDGSRRSNCAGSLSRWPSERRKLSTAARGLAGCAGCLVEAAG
eukprot:1301176-Prymnesium_polylepis.1